MLLKAPPETSMFVIFWTVLYNGIIELYETIKWTSDSWCCLGVQICI
jgi:hypothetical protein